MMRALPCIRLAEPIPQSIQRFRRNVGLFVRHHTILRWVLLDERESILLELSPTHIGPMHDSHAMRTAGVTGESSVGPTRDAVANVVSARGSSH